MRPPSTSPQLQHSPYVFPSQTQPPTHTRHARDRDSALTRSGYVDANSLVESYGSALESQYHEFVNGMQSHREHQSDSEDHMKTNVYRLASNNSTECLLPRNDELTHCYENYPPSTSGTRHSQTEGAYSVVGIRGPIYQGLVPQTMNYLSLYHTVTKTTTQ